MKTKLILLSGAIVVLTFACPVVQTGQMQEAPAPQQQKPREAKPEEVPFTFDPNVFDKVTIEEVPKRVVQPEDFPEDAPAHSCFHLEDKRPLPALDQGPRYFLPSFSVVCIIPLVDKSVRNFAKSYPSLSEAAARLRKLLARRPARFRFHKDLSDMPFNNATGVIESRVQYLSFKNGRGVLFLTQYSQEVEANPINNEELTCNFQGLTNDGKYYVAARLAITHPSLPKGIDFTSHIVRDDKQLYLKRQEKELNGFAEGSFQPSLRVLKSLLASISAK